MLKENSHFKTILGLLTVSLLLIYIDYQVTVSGNSSSLFAGILDSFSSSGTITEELLSKTSLTNSSVTSLGKSDTFFDSYLNLPEKTRTRKYNIVGSSIIISEVKSTDLRELVSYLTNQESKQYSFNKINNRTFYLNQTPANTKTHNFLGIVINDTLYGIQYLPKEHQKVLEIIDALQKIP